MIKQESKALRITALGGLSIQENGVPVTGFVSRKVDALLVYLASTRREHPREALAELLWDDLPQARAMANLRMVLSSLTQRLAAYVIVSRQTVAINLDSPYWLDAAELEDALDSAHEQAEAQGGLTPAATERLEHVLTLYQGDFLAGFHVRDGRAFEDWTLIEQERLRNRVIEAYQQLVNDSSERGDFANGIAQARRLLQLDPLLEEGHRQLMTMLAQSGQRSAALAQYEVCRQVLADELAVEPDEETTGLYEAIQTGQFRVAAEPSVLPRNLNLPSQATPFVGRSAELAQIARQLAEPGCRLLTLVGPGGSGKTRLALQAGIERMKDFRHGVTVISLVAATSPNDLPSAIAGALKMPLKPIGDLTGQVIDYLSDKHILLVMDNLEYVLEGVGILSDILANCLALKIVATSRERLNLQEEWIMNVGGMDVPDENADTEKVTEIANDSAYSAVQLFVLSARRAKVDFSLEGNHSNGNLAAVIRICKLVEGLPLGIELAAAWVHILSCDQIAYQIERDLDFLASPLRNVPERHRSLRVLFEESWQRLLPDERIVLMKLSVFRDSFDLPGAIEVAGATLTTLSALGGRFLLRMAASGRYSIHELLRRFAYDKLIEAGEVQKTLAIHCGFFTGRAEALEQLERSDESIYQRFDADYANMRAALAWALENRQVEFVLRLGSALANYWKARGLGAEGRRWLGAGLDLALTHQGEDYMYNATPIEVQARALTNAGILAWNQSDFDPARTLLEGGLHRYRQLRDYGGITKALNHLGYVALNIGDHATARVYFEEMLVISRKRGQAHATAMALGSLGLVASELMDYEQAETYLKEGLAIFRQLGQKERMGVLLNNLGIVYLKTADYSRAQASLEESLSLARKLGHKPNIAFLVANLGEVAHKTGDFERAKALYGESLSLLRETGDRLSATMLLESAANLSMAQGKAERAARLFGAAEAMRESLGAPIMPRERPDYEQSVMLTLNALNERTFKGEWTRGRSMTLDQAIAYAMD